MKSKQPLISIIVPTKNNIRTIERCLQSVKNQSYKNIELIIVDNHSTDGTLAVAKKFTDKAFTKGPERGAQRSFGVEKAVGDFLAFIDSDMYLDKGVMAECVAIADTDISGVYIPEESAGQGFWAQCKSLERSFYVDIPWMNAARFFSKENYLKVGGYDREMISGEDWDLSQKLEKIGKISHTKSFIVHDEGTISLLQTVKKKYYYSTKFPHYLKNNKNSESTSNQTSILERYLVFLKQPLKLFRNPILGLGVLFMKTCEFAAGGVGYLISKND